MTSIVIAICLFGLGAALNLITLVFVRRLAAYQISLRELQVGIETALHRAELQRAEMRLISAIDVAVVGHGLRGQAAVDAAKHREPEAYALLMTTKQDAPLMLWARDRVTQSAADSPARK